MRPFLSARTYDGYAFPADDPRDHRIFPICRKVKALGKYNQAYQLLEYQTCKDWRRLSLKLTSTPPPPIPALFNSCNCYATKCYRAHMTPNTHIWKWLRCGQASGRLVVAWEFREELTKRSALPPSSVAKHYKVLLKYYTSSLKYCNALQSITKV